MSSHWYSSDGTLVDPQTPGSLPSVTTILAVRANPGLQSWRDRVGAEEADRVGLEATDKGTYVHGWIEGVLKKEIVLIDGMPHKLLPHLPYLIGFVNWVHKALPTDIQPEIFLWSPEHGYAGRCDLICQIDGEWWLIDFKTSKHIRPEYGLQLAAYAKIWEDDHPGLKLRRAVLQLTDKIKRGYRFQEFTDPMDIYVFYAHRDILKWMLGTEKVQDKAPQWEMV